MDSITEVSSFDCYSIKSKFDLIELEFVNAHGYTILLRELENNNNEKMFKIPNYRQVKCTLRIEKDQKIISIMTFNNEKNRLVLDHIAMALLNTFKNN